MDNRTQQFITAYKDKTFEYPALPDMKKQEQVEWIYTQSNAPWLELCIDAPYKAMLAEAQSVRELFVAHRGDENSHRGWLSLCIHGISATHTGSAESYGLTRHTANYAWTEIQDRCPVTVDYFKNTFPFNRYQRLRFMLLEPGGYITPHNDNKISHLNSAVNISLNQPTDCNLVTTAGCLPFKDSGSVFLFNNYYQHVVYNNSDTDRYHIIVHGDYRDPDWSQLVVDSYKKVYHG
jgi:hypothetical protein